MLIFVERVSRQPDDVPLRGRRKVVHAFSVPRRLVDAAEAVRHERRGDANLLRHLFRFALRVPGQRHSLLPVDRCEARAVLHQGEEQPFALGKKYISDVAGVLQARPDIRRRSEPEQAIAPGVPTRLKQAASQPRTERGQLVHYGGGHMLVVDEPTHVAAIHTREVSTRARQRTACPLARRSGSETALLRKLTSARGDAHVVAIRVHEPEVPEPPPPIAERFNVSTMPLCL